MSEPVDRRPTHALWTRHALLVAPYAEFLGLLFYLSDDFGDRIRIAVWIALLIPFSMLVARPVVEPMLPEDPRNPGSENIPARLSEFKPGEAYKEQYGNLVPKPFDHTATSYTRRTDIKVKKHGAGWWSETQ
jgi:hypothetical protein